MDTKIGPEFVSVSAMSMIQIRLDKPASAPYSACLSHTCTTIIPAMGNEGYYEVTMNS